MRIHGRLDRDLLFPSSGAVRCHLDELLVCDCGRADGVSRGVVCGNPQEGVSGAEGHVGGGGAEAGEGGGDSCWDGEYRQWRGRGQGGEGGVVAQWSWEEAEMAKIKSGHLKG